MEQYTKEMAEDTECAANKLTILNSSEFFDEIQDMLHGLKPATKSSFKLVKLRDVYEFLTGLGLENAALCATEDVEEVSSLDSSDTE